MTIDPDDYDLDDDLDLVDMSHVQTLADCDQEDALNEAWAAAVRHRPEFGPWKRTYDKFALAVAERRNEIRVRDWKR